MLVAARRWYRIILALVIGAVLFLLARRLLGGASDRIVADPTPAAPPATPSPRPSPAGDPLPAVGPEREAPTPEPVDEDPATDPAANPDAWVQPTGGACPTTHPVKVKESSGIFHVAGGMNYERTNADRCYLSPEAAEADGYRAAKR